METIFISSENRNTSDPNRLILKVGLSPYKKLALFASLKALHK